MIHLKIGTKQEMERKKTLEYINYFRAIAILLIVAGHTVVWGKNTMFTTNAYLFYGATFLFVFISGFLFEYLSYKFEYKTYLKKKFINVIMPFIIITLPIAIIYSQTKLDIENSYINASKIFRFFICLFQSPMVNPPMWYMGMIIIFFLCAPLFVLIKKNRYIWYSSILCAIIYTLLSNRTYFQIPPLESGIKNIIYTNIYFYFKQFFYYMSAYLGGMLVSDILEKYTTTIQKYRKEILIITSIGLLFEFVEHLFVIKLSYHISGLQKFLECILFVSLFMIYEEKIKNIKWLNTSLKFTADYSFGIFFIHYLFLNIIYCHSIYTCNPLSPPSFLFKNTIHAFLYSIFIYIIVLLFSITILYILKKILKFFGIKNTRMFIGV